MTRRSLRGASFTLSPIFLAASLDEGWQNLPAHGGSRLAPGIV
ncbi:MAG: hypothetical protein SNJ52_01000 [Verrucomicrobiia bacterium]